MSTQMSTQWVNLGNILLSDWGYKCQSLSKILPRFTHWVLSELLVGSTNCRAVEGIQACSIQESTHHDHVNHRGGYLNGNNANSLYHTWFKGCWIL